MEDIAKKSHILGGLNKASYIELFYDLVFIVCMRSITPVLSSVEGDYVGWYECYTFLFCFVLMIQVWFSSTVFMNRCGTGGFKDAPFLLINMSLIFLMTRGISVTWEHYAEFNVLWMLTNVNLIVHWLLRFRELPPEDAQANKPFLRRVVIVHATVIVLVFASFFFDNVLAQVCCLLALLVGFASWPSLTPLSEPGREHLAERCALFLILTFGETLVGLSGSVTETAEQSGMGMGMVTAVFYFLIIVGMFLVYLVHVEKKLDVSRLRSGSGYMAITMLLAFCVMGITAIFELSIESKRLWFASSSDFFALMASIYLFAFFLFTPFIKPRVRKSKGWVVARAVACSLPLLVDLLADVVVVLAVQELSNQSILGLLAVAIALFGTLVVFMFSTFVVFVIDYKAYTPKRKKSLKGTSKA